MTAEALIMTEKQWISITDPSIFLSYLVRNTASRKVSLVACACCRTFWHFLVDERSRNVIEQTEKLADGMIAPDVHEQACDAALAALEEIEEICTRQREMGEEEVDPMGAAERAHQAAVVSWEFVFNTAHEPQHAATVLAFLRDIFGNPFRPVSIDPEWLSPAVVALSRGMYDPRDFSAMPILADALQDAGCEHPFILAHCRGDDPHVRGCWVVDLLLGKE